MILLLMYALNARSCEAVQKFLFLGEGVVVGHRARCFISSSEFNYDRLPLAVVAIVLPVCFMCHSSGFILQIILEFIPFCILRHITCGVTCPHI